MLKAETNPYCASTDQEYITVPQFTLENGTIVKDVEIAYKTFGQGATVLVCHAMTGSANVADWWAGMMEAFNGYRVICCNMPGSCYGTFSPMSYDKTGARHGAQFPRFSIRDSVRLHRHVLQYLQVTELEVVIGASIGGMVALEWAATYPSMVKRLCVIACGLQQSAWGIAMGEVQRQSIYSDINYCKGQYYQSSPKDSHVNVDWQQPVHGLGNARMQAMLTYKSAASFERKFGRLTGSCHKQFDCHDPFHEADVYKTSSYLRYQALKFTQRFDANCYVALTHTLDTHDVLRGRQQVFDSRLKVLVIGVLSDILYPPCMQEEIHQLALKEGCQSQLHILDSDEGHDGFLVADKEVARAFSNWLLL